MRNYFLILLSTIVLGCMLFMTVHPSYGQNDSISIREIFDNLKKEQLGPSAILKRERFRQFDFDSFKPNILLSIEEDSYFEVGYNQNGKIVEIIHRETRKELENYKLLIFEFPKYKILELQILVGKSYMFTPCVIVKTNFQDNYLLNVAPQFGTDSKYRSSLYYEKFPVRLIKDFSVIMKLDKNLYPSQILRLSNGHIVMASDIQYESPVSYKIIKEVASFFLTPEFYPKLRITDETYLPNVFFEVLKPDLILILHPNMHGYDHAPLWIFGGAHEYR